MLTLKYRPQRFSEVLGFPENVRILKGMVKNPARAMRSVILAGEYGNGKTTLARIFGRAVNCQGKTGDACGACANCRAVADDASRLYLELDSTQAGNVESMRNLREILPYSLEEGFRVVVFDECQRISHAAQTNLLKALEEAPPTLFWVFCTTELDKIIKPIQSRSLLVEFGLMGDEDVATLVSRTAQAEGEPVSAEAVRRIVRRAGGHARNALVQLHLLYLLGEREYLDSVPEFDKMLQEMVTSFAEEQGLSDRGVAIIQKILSYPVAYVAQDFERFAVGMAKKAYVDRTGASAKDRLLVAAWLKWHRYLVTAPDWFAFLTGIASLYERNGGGPRIF